MRPALTPPHLLLLDHPLADNLIDRRFGEGRGNQLAVAVPVESISNRRLRGGEPGQSPD
jgi:hypothetical protein